MKIKKMLTDKIVCNMFIHETEWIKKTVIELQNVVYPCVYHDKLLQIEGICLACFSSVSFLLEHTIINAKIQWFWIFAQII